VTAWLERKREAADLFISHLLASPARSHIAKVLLHGSVAEGTAQPESDVDVVVFQIGAPEVVADVCDEASFRVVMEVSESIEPLIFSMGEYHHPFSYFLYRATQDGEELYSVTAEELKREEIEGLYELGLDYLEGARELEQNGRYRLATDTAYNAAELAGLSEIRPASQNAQRRGEQIRRALYQKRDSAGQPGQAAAACSPLSQSGPLRTTQPLSAPMRPDKPSNWPRNS